MKYFMDTHDKTKGSFQAEKLTEEQFFAQFDALEAAGYELGVFAHAAHVNLHNSSGAEPRAESTPQARDRAPA